MSFIEERTCSVVRFIIQCLNGEGQERILTMRYHPKRGMIWGRTYGDSAASKDVVKELSERKALEVLEWAKNTLNREFDPENEDAEGWESHNIRELKGLNSFAITKVVISTELRRARCSGLQLDCNPSRGL